MEPVGLSGAARVRRIARVTTHDPRLSPYHDRARAPAETVALMQPHFATLGITRLARQTGLDRVGIPCFAAFRPNSRSIACNQGKGIDDDMARASAVMEAVEYAIAEAPEGEPRRAAIGDLEAEGALWFDPWRSLPLGETLDPEREIAWVAGRRLRDGREILIPLERVGMSGVRDDLPLLCQHTNGLASGNDRDEASFHGLCELIERDAATLWSLLEPEQRATRCLDPASFGDVVVVDLVQRFESAGLRVRLFDQTSDLGVPTILCVSAPSDGVVVKHFDIATGAGTHPHPARAALRALTEAAQTRVTSIAGARDDVRPDTYRLDGSEEAFELLSAEPVRGAPAVETPVPASAGDLLGNLVGTLVSRGVDDIVAVPVGGERMGISVMRMLSNLLEDRGPNANWRPGPRALAALLD